MIIKKISQQILTPILVDSLQLDQQNKAVPTISAHTVAFSAEIADQIVGGITAKITGENLYISLFAVSSQQQHQGIGAKLIEKIEAYALAEKLTTITLTTKSYQALDFYLKQGYQTFAELTDVPVRGITKYYLLKRLS